MIWKILMTGIRMNIEIKIYNIDSKMNIWIVIFKIYIEILSNQINKFN